MTFFKITPWHDKVPRRHFITVKMFPGEQATARGQWRGYAVHGRSGAAHGVLSAGCINLRIN